MDDELNNQLTEALFMAFRSMKDSMSFNSKSSNLTMVQLEALIFLGKKNQVQMKDISDNFCITMPTATSLIDKLIVLKLAVRRTSVKDRRIVKIAITAQGKKLLDEAMRQRKGKVHRLLSYLSNKDKKELLRILLSVSEKASA